MGVYVQQCILNLRMHLQFATEYGGWKDKSNIGELYNMVKQMLGNQKGYTVFYPRKGKVSLSFYHKYIYTLIIFCHNDSHSHCASVTQTPCLFFIYPFAQTQPPDRHIGQHIGGWALLAHVIRHGTRQFVHTSFTPWHSGGAEAETRAALLFRGGDVGWWNVTICHQKLILLTVYPDTYRWTPKWWKVWVLNLHM